MPQQQTSQAGQRFIGVWLDANLAKRLRASARRQDRTVSAVIRKLVREELARSIGERVA